MELQTEAPVTLMITEEPPQKMTLELPNWENFKCQRHPPFKVDALSLNEDDHSDAKLLCIKCIVEGDYFSSMSSKKLITIKDLIQKCFEGGKSNSGVTVQPNNGLEEKFLDFLTQDYIGTYERHLEGQYHIIDQEIKGVIENLGKLRDKYKDYYAEELVTLRIKAEDIKKKIRRYLDENSSSENMAFSSVNQMLQQFTTLQSTGEFCEFLKGLYCKSKEMTEDKKDTYDYTQTLKTLEEFKFKASNLDEKVAELNHFQEMNKTINLMLKSEGHMFKRIKNAALQNQSLKPSDPNRIFSYPSVSSLKINESTSSFSEDIFLSTSETFRPTDPLIMVKTKKRSGNFRDIDSQSLRNLKKELDEKENSEPNQLMESTKKRTVRALSDWINRRITGYLIFQNTVNMDPQTSKEKTECTELGVHFNQMVGHKWKNLTRAERDEYQDIAKDYRRRFRKEIEDREDSEDLGDLFHEFDTQIKKIKKE